MQAQTPDTPPQPPRKSRLWPWIVGLVVALGAGYGAGAAGDPEPAAAEPTPAETVEVEVPGEVPAADLAALDEREQKLDDRAAKLDERKANLDERETAIEQTETDVAENSIPGTGLFIVGEDIEPGRYRSGGTDCYWARLSSTDTSDMITNWYDSGPTVVDIAESDVAFETSGCDEWVKQ